MNNEITYNKLYNILNTLLKEAYPDKKYKRFKLLLENKECRSFYGDYRYSDCRIRVLTQNATSSHIILTAIHELSHHIDYCNRNKSAHDKEFYKIYKFLLQYSLNLNILKYEAICKQYDIKNLERKVGALNEINSIKDNRKNLIYLIYVYNGYSIKDNLKNLNYKFDGSSKAWYREIDSIDLRDEINKLNTLTSIKNIKYEIKN